MPLLPDSDGNIATTISNTDATIITFNFTDIPPLIYRVLIYRNPILSFLSGNVNHQYVGINNNKLHDMNSTNNSDGFTINFKYDNTAELYL